MAIRHAFVQCVANVLTNAAKYTDANGDIRIEWHRDGDTGVITISDNGPRHRGGSLCRTCSSCSYREPAPSIARKVASGSASSVVKRLIEMHGGAVSVQNLDGDRGTLLRIPAAAHRREG